MSTWMPTSPVVDLAAAQAEVNFLDAISACRISACVAEGPRGRMGSCRCSGVISACSAISACILDYPCYHLSNETPLYFWHIIGPRSHFWLKTVFARYHPPVALDEACSSLPALSALGYAAADNNSIWPLPVAMQ